MFQELGKETQAGNQTEQQQGNQTAGGQQQGNQTAGGQQQGNQTAGGQQQGNQTENKSILEKLGEAVGLS
jgi:hypothetical protein